MLCAQVMKYKLATPMTGLDVGLKREWLIGQQLNTITGEDGELHGTLWTSVQPSLQLLIVIFGCKCTHHLYVGCSQMHVVAWWLDDLYIIESIYTRHADYCSLLLIQDTSMACWIAVCAYLHAVMFLAQ